jgi:hypothetical protein
MKFGSLAIGGVDNINDNERNIVLRALCCLGGF